MEVLNCVKFRVAIVGSNRNRVAKVLSLLASNDMQHSSQPDENLSTVDSHDQISTILRHNVEYMGCVATFDSYDDENDRKSIRYLSKIEYHGANAARVRGSSLAPFFDDAESDFDDSHDNQSKIKRIPGIAAVAIGCGIETEKDIAMIMKFFQSMSIHKKVELRLPGDATKSHASQGDGDSENPTIVKCVHPNAQYLSMEDENQAYKNMSLDEKRLVTLNRTIGPGKMANFVQSLANEIATAHHIILPSLPTSQSPPSNVAPISDNTENIPILKKCPIEHNNSTKNESKQNDLTENYPIDHVNNNQQQQENIHNIKTATQFSNKTQFACKQCRLVLFNEDDLEDPPHAKAQHSFNGVKGTSSCSSIFLAEGLDWMGNITSSMEGKLCCPKCSAKLGLWNWAGTQCSCGTWVTPAIKIQLNRVDVILADDINHNRITDCCGAVLPPGTVIPTIL